jgi:hypothetical protein
MPYKSHVNSQYKLMPNMYWKCTYQDAGVAANGNMQNCQIIHQVSLYNFGILPKNTGLDHNMKAMIL